MTYQLLRDLCMSKIENPILKEFLIESLDNLSSISEELTRYEKEFERPTDPDLIHSIYRKVHTLKGSASFLAFSKLESLTHSAENILDHFREGNLKPSESIIDLLLESFDKSLEMIRHIEANGNEGDFDNSSLTGRLMSLLEHQLLNEKSVKSEIVLDYSGEIVEKTQEDLIGKEVKNKIIKERPNIAAIEKKKMSQKTEKKETVPIVKTVIDSTIRVNVKLLDKILNVVGELVLNRNQILQLSKENEEAELSRLSHQLNVITRELQTDIMATRMQPVGAVFNKFERIVRDLSRKQNKKIKLEIQGQDTELDKTLLEVIKDPLTHLVRNAIDHGIETPEERLLKGKSETGELVIKAFHAGGQVIVEISDNGNGINLERVLEKAVAKGIMTAGEAERCPPEKTVNFIFHPGFSTAAEVTNISGRGVGMDVVKSNIEKIGGKCEIISKEGEGTTFKLSIPLTLAIVPALVVKGGGETFAIPQKNLVELVLLDENEFDEIEKLYDSELFRLRGELIPIFRINKGLRLSKDLEPEDNINIVVLSSEFGTYGLIVDDILDTEEIVVKPLSRKLRSGSIYAGATIMGDGKVALILDAVGLFNMLDTGKSHGDHQKRNSHDDQLEKKFENEEILLFELDDERHYGIPLSLISRLEEFQGSKIEMSGKQSLIKYRGAAMPLVYLNNEVSYKEKRVLDRRKSDAPEESAEEEKNESFPVHPCIVSSIGGNNIGFMVDKIIDIAKTDSEIDQDNVKTNSIMGTAYVDDHLITIVDIHKIIDDLKLKKTKIEKGNCLVKILVVEDSILYQRILQDALETQGFDVMLAENGRIGLSLLEDDSLHFDIIITDIEMPEMNGFELVQRVRSLQNKYKDIPIVSVTTRVSESDLKKGRELGINTHLEKLNKDQVIKAVNELLRA